MSKSKAVQDWYFTFGHGQEHFGGYVKINGTFADARMEMFARYKDKWSMQYDAVKGFEVVTRFSLVEVK